MHTPLLILFPKRRLKKKSPLIPNAIIEEKENAVTAHSVTEYVTAKNLTLHQSWVKNDTAK